MKVFVVNGVLQGGMDWYPIPLLGDDTSIADLHMASLGHVSINGGMDFHPVPLLADGQRGLGFVKDGRKGGLDTFTWKEAKLTPYNIPTTYKDRNGRTRTFVAFENLNKFLNTTIQIPLFVRTSRILSETIDFVETTFSKFNIKSPKWDSKNKIAQTINLLKRAVSDIQNKINDITGMTFDFRWKEVAGQKRWRGYRGKDFFKAVEKSFQDMADYYTNFKTITASDILNPVNAVSKFATNVSKVRNGVYAGAFLTNKFSTQAVSFTKDINAMQKKAVDYAIKLFSELPTEITNYISTLISNVELVSGKASSEIQSVVTGIGITVRTYLKELVNAITLDLKDMIVNIKTYISNLIKNIIADSEDFVDYTIYMALSLKDYIYAQAKAISDSAVANVQGMTKAIEDEINHYVTEVYNTVQKYIDKSIGALEKEYNKLLADMQKFVNETEAKVRKTYQEIEVKINKMYDELNKQAQLLLARIQKAEVWMSDAEQRFTFIEAELKAIQNRLSMTPSKTTSWWPFKGLSTYEELDRQVRSTKVQFAGGHGLGTLAVDMAQPERGLLQDRDFVSRSGLM